MAFKRNYGAAVAVALLMGIISLIFGGGNVTERLQYSDTVEYSGSASQNVIEDFLSSPKGMLFAGIATSTRAGAIPFSMLPRPGFLFQGVPLSPSSDYFTV